MTEFSYDKLLDALDLHQNLLYAEKQAIDARDLDTVESILSQKDESLSWVLTAKNQVDSNYPSHIRSRINSVLNLQERNTQNFKKLHVQDDKPHQSEEVSNPLFRRARRAYLK